MVGFSEANVGSDAKYRHGINIWNARTHRYLRCLFHSTDAFGTWHLENKRCWIFLLLLKRPMISHAISHCSNYLRENRAHDTKTPC
jgi:hypothetical protein